MHSFIGVVNYLCHSLVKVKVKVVGVNTILALSILFLFQE